MSQTPDGHPGTRAVPRTDWAGLSMDQLAATLANHRIEMSDEHVQGWSMIYELLDYHGSRLRTYRSLLSERWPADSSAAAAAFLDQLDELITSVDELSKAAPVNNGTLIHVASTLTETKSKLDPLVRSWHSYEESITRAAATNGKSAAYYRGEQSKVHDEAVTLMARTSGQVTDANQSFLIPPTFQPDSPIQTVAVIGDIGGQSDTATGHHISSDSPWSSSPDTTQGMTATPVLAGRPPAGAGTAPPPPTLAPGFGAGPSASGSERPPQAGVWPARVPQPNAEWRARAARYGGRDLTNDSVDSRVSNGAAADRTARIGRTSGTAVDEEEAPHGGIGAAPLGGAVGRSQSRRGKRSSDPYFEWTAARGVPPVLRPPDEPTEHDPGPIFGIPR